MILLIQLFGTVIAVAGVLLLVRPAVLIGLIESQGERTWLYALAVGARVVLGLLLLQAAAYSRFPLLIEVLGWISLAAALLLAAMGRARFGRFINWIIEKVKPFARAGGVIAVVFGAFLVYAFV